MKKGLVYAISATLLLSSCNSYTGMGAYTGSSLGSILGSAIGGIAGGPRGPDLGTLVGMAVGAAIGAAVGAKADQQEQQRVHDHYDRVQQNRAQGINPYNPTNKMKPEEGNCCPIDTTNSGDDRIYDFHGEDYTGNYSAAQPVSAPLATDMANASQVEISNVRFVDDNQDGALGRGELSKVIFEVKNRGQFPVDDIQPMVVETTGNKHIYISPSVHIESIAPGAGIRYTAMVKADNRLRNGLTNFSVSVLQGNKTLGQTVQFSIPTKK